MPDEITDKFAASWTCHTPNLLKEILNNPSCWILTRPLQIFGRQLFQVAEIAARINDPELNKMMVIMTLYECANPESPNYDQELCDKVLGRNNGEDNE